MTLTVSGSYAYDGEAGWVRRARPREASPDRRASPMTWRAGFPPSPIRPVLWSNTCATRMAKHPLRRLSDGNTEPLPRVATSANPRVNPDAPRRQVSCW